MELKKELVLLFLIIFAFILILTKRKQIKEILVSLLSFIKKVIKLLIKVWGDKELRRFWIIFASNAALKLLIDYPLNYRLMIEFGYRKSFIITSLIYIFIGLISVVIHDWIGKDIIFMRKWRENQKKITAYKNPFVKFLMKRSFFNKLVICFGLSFKNLGLLILYLRKKNGNWVDTIVLGFYFLIAAVSINLYWNAMVYSGISLWDLIGEALLWLELNFWPILIF